MHRGRGQSQEGCGCRESGYIHKHTQSKNIKKGLHRKREKEGTGLMVWVGLGPGRVYDTPLLSVKDG